MTIQTRVASTCVFVCCNKASRICVFYVYYKLVKHITRCCFLRGRRHSRFRSFLSIDSVIQRILDSVPMVCTCFLWPPEIPQLLGQIHRLSKPGVDALLLRADFYSNVVRGLFHPHECRSTFKKVAPCLGNGHYNRDARLWGAVCLKWCNNFSCIIQTYLIHFQSILWLRQVNQIISRFGFVTSSSKWNNAPFRRCQQVASVIGNIPVLLKTRLGESDILLKVRVYLPYMLSKVLEIALRSNNIEEE